MNVIACLEEPEILQRLVEKLAIRFTDFNDGDLLTEEWKAVDTSSLEGYANGDILLSNENHLINSLFDTCFIFTCIKEKNRNFQLTWVCSLS